MSFSNTSTPRDDSFQNKCVFTDDDLKRLQSFVHGMDGAYFKNSDLPALLARLEKAEAYIETYVHRYWKKKVEKACAEGFSQGIVRAARHLEAYRDINYTLRAKEIRALRMKVERD